MFAPVGIGENCEGVALSKAMDITNARHRIAVDVDISTLLPSAPVWALTWASQRNRFGGRVVTLVNLKEQKCWQSGTLRS